MIKPIFENHSKLQVNEAVEAVSIEEKIRKVITSNEPIEQTAPMIYTERKDGVLAAYDPRTDRWEIAQAAMDKVTKTITSQRDNKPDTEPTKPTEPTEPTEPTNNNN